MKIVVADKIQGLDFAPEHIKTLEALGEFEVFATNPKNEDEIVERAHGADVLVMYGFVPLPASVITRFTTVKYIIAAAIGYNWIDLVAAEEMGISVSNAPAHNSRAVAEYTIMLIIAVARKLKESLLDLDAGDWKYDFYKGFEIAGKRLGIFGYGNIGKEVAKIASAGFGMNVDYYNTTSSASDLERLLQNSDIVVSTLPLNTSTQKFFSDEKFALMKDGVVFINVGRGAVVDEEALLTHIQSGKISAAALDVLSDESSTGASAFLKMPNVIITPHSAFNTLEAERNLSQVVTENVIAFAAGAPINIIKNN